MSHECERQDECACRMGCARHTSVTTVLCVLQLQELENTGFAYSMKSSSGKVAKTEGGAPMW